MIRSETAESPVWDVHRQELIWVDIPAGLIHRADPDAGTVSTTAVGQPVGAVALRRGGGLVAAVRDGFAFIDEQTGTADLVAEVETENPATRMNDGACDSSGRFWAGTMAYDMSIGAGALYRIDDTLAVVKVLAGVSVSNGIAWDDEEKLMFYVDSGLGRVDVFDYEPESGLVSNRRPLIPIPPYALPDGLALDDEGLLWVALWDGSAVHRYNRQGDLDTVVELPTPQVTSCSFGGPRLDELFVTSAWAGMDDEQRRHQPLAGAVFRVDLGVSGPRPYDFVG